MFPARNRPYPPTDMTALQERRAQVFRDELLIQQQMHELITRRRTVRSEYNACSPACQLPNELLADVFLWISAYQQTCDRFKATEIIGLTHVCRHWRAVALSCKKLWSFIGETSEECIFVFLQRSGNVPVDYTWSRETEGVPAIIRLYPSRFRSLDVVTTPESIKELSWALQNSHWDQLESLILVVGVDSMDVYVHSDLAFAGSVPQKLRTLKLDGVLPSWSNTAIYRNLRVLDFLYQDSKSGLDLDFATVPEIVEILSVCSFLEEFNLYVPGIESLGNGEDVHVPPPERIVELKNLRVFTYATFLPWDIGYLLAHLDIPATAHVLLSPLKPSVRPVPPPFSKCLPCDLSRLRGTETAGSIRFQTRDPCIYAFQEDHALSENLEDPCLGIVFRDYRDYRLNTRHISQDQPAGVVWLIIICMPELQLTAAPV
ncbi:hypothetical protein EIP91_012387 [Steccherinum ochraceum]|uniref:F-box domain-containing protein n=1 Tax=Steccherinum ochraceum TaxID=92696 RepID=A0A4R0RN12_9APHY|nr:hypothetical protein EIP91_012387 [Steccherinum ochraceum]